MADLKSIVRIRLIVLVAILASLAPFSVSQVLMARHNTDMALESVERTMMASLKRIEGMFNDARRELERLSSTIALISTSPKFTPEDCQQKVQDVLAIYDKAERISLLYPNGVAFCSSDPKALGVSFADRDYFQRALSSPMVVWSDLLTSRITNRVLLQSARAVWERGAISYVVTVSLNLAALKRATFEQVDVPLTQAVLVDKDGQVLDSVTYDENAPPIRSDVIALAINSDSGILHPPGVEKSLFAVAMVGGIQGRLIFETPVSAIYAKADRDMLSGIVLVGIETVLIAALLMLALDWLILRGLRHVIVVAHRISTGDQHCRVKLTSPLPELTVLSRSINMMVDRLESAVLTDVLTDIPNRRALDVHLDNSARRLQRFGTGFSLVMIDIDHFKRFNDSYGHSVGDQVLKSVGKTLERFARRPDEIAARYGGEEFMLVLTETDAGKLAVHLENLRCAIEALGITHAGSPYAVVTISMGFAIINRDDEVPAALTRADEALYCAKSKGRNRVENADATNDGGAAPDCPAVI